MPNTARKTPTRSTDEKRLKQANVRAPQVGAPQSQAGELSRAVENLDIATPANLVSLQRRYGNRAVQRLTQPKPAPAPAPAADTETYEQEAEPAGEAVLAGAPVAAQPRPFGDDDGQPNSTAVIQRLPLPGGERVQRYSLPPATATVEDVAELPTATGLAEAPATQPQAPAAEGSVTNASLGAPAATTAPQASEAAPAQDAAPANAAPAAATTTAPAPANAAPATSLEMQSLAHEEKIRPLLKRYMTSQNTDRNYDFYFDASDSQSLYKKYIRGGAPKQINLGVPTRGKLDELAQSKQWRAMGRPIDEARAENQEIINTKVLPGFEQSDEFQKYSATRRPEPGAARAGSALAGLKEKVADWRALRSSPAVVRQEIVTKAYIARLEKNIADYTGWLANGKKTIADVGLPTNAAEKKKAVDRMFQGGRYRHRTVVDLFTRRARVDKFFRKQFYPAFFNKLQDFTKLWVEYRKLLGR